MRFTLDRTLLTAILFSLLVPQLSLAEVYRWVDEKGRVHFSDTPPKQLEVSRVEIDSNRSNGIVLMINPTGQGITQAKKSSKKVVLYGTSWCGVCKKAKNYFKAHGIPFTEYDIENSARGKRDYRRMRGRGVPIILVDKQRMNGFSQGNFEKLYGG